MNSLSKKDVVKARVRSLIDRGVYPPGSKLPPDTELPREFNASKVTVVRALKELEDEGFVFRRRGSGTFIKQHRMAPIVQGKKFRIAVAWHTRVFPGKLHDDPFGVITRAMLDELGLGALGPSWADEREHAVQTWAKWDAPDSPACVDVLGPSADCLEHHPPLGLVKEGEYDAVVTVSLNHDPWLNQLLELGIPTMLVDYCSRQFDLKADQVFYDPVSAYQEAVQYMIDRGRKNIHFVGGFIHPPLASRNGLTVQEAKQKRGSSENRMIEPDTHFRLSAYRQAMEAAGRPVDESMVHFSFLHDPYVAEFAETMAARTDAPDAFVCHSDQQAERIIKAFRKKGRNVLAAGAGKKANGRGLRILADQVQLGKTAGAILISRLRQLDRLPLRVGVPLQFKS